MPTEPPPSPWLLTLADATAGEDLVGVGADLAPGTLLAAYRAGIFPMGLGVDGGRPLGWWSPDPRGVLLPGDLHVSRSLRRSRRSFEVRIDTAFHEVILACADPTRRGRWITPEVVEAYLHLHELGWAHSVEVWYQGQLAGGLYGMAIGRLFAAESMFHRKTDAGKAAVASLVDLMGASPWMIDVQWQTPHLRTLGVRQLPRAAYVEHLAGLVAEPLPDCWRAPGHVQGDQVPESDSGTGMVPTCHARKREKL